MNKKLPIPMILLTAVLLLLTGCTVPDYTAEFWTNIPEMTAYADLFNSRQDRFRIKIVYKENPGDALLSGAGAPDLIVAENLNSAKFDDLLEDLSPLLDPEKGNIQGGNFYQDLLVTGQNSEGAQKTLPVSFNLPLFYYKTGNGVTDENDGLFSWEDLSAEGENFTGTDDFPVRSFVPLWSGHYLYARTKLGGSDFQETDGSFPQWNRDKLEETLEEVKALAPPAPPRQEDDEDYPPEGSLEWELAFQEKYLYQPWHKSVNAGRVLYAFTSMREYHLIPPGEKKSLGIRWASDGEIVPVRDDIIWAGILKRAEDKKSAEAFLEWFFQPESQKTILESSQYKRIRSFGIARGFSSLHLINELDFPRYFPILEGKIPGRGELVFPEKLPRGWDKILEDVVIPWLLDESTLTTHKTSLEESLQNWYNLRPELQ